VKDTVVKGVTDNRSLDLALVASQGVEVITGQLQHVLPVDETQRVVVAQFNASI